VEVDVGPPRAKTVHGIVRTARGLAASGARVTAMFDNRETATAVADGDGKYTLKTYAGAAIVAGDGDHVANGTVGTANVDDEQVDLVLGR